MKKAATYFFLLCIVSSAFSQARLVMDNDAYIVISNAAYVVLDNGNANALAQTGTGGRIISEAESNRIRWNISNNTGTYTIPYYDNDNALEIPFVLTIGTAGSAGGAIDFSTYDNPSWDNATYMPSDVTNMNSYIGGPNNSAKVCDRFWITDAASYGTKPAATLSFTYIDAEWSAAGNTITEGNLGAQRFNTPAANWDAYVPQGTVNTAANTVSAVPAAPADFFRSWVLVDNLSPLPIQLVSAAAACQEQEMVIAWTTASETNNDFFTIERSINGTDFIAIGTVNGAGNSSSMLSYSITDHNAPEGTIYYRISQTDFNGSSVTFPLIIANGCAENLTGVNAFNNQQGSLVIDISTAAAAQYDALLFDAVGQIICKKILHAEKGSSQFRIDISHINAGVYFISLQDHNSRITRKILIN